MHEQDGVVKKYVDLHIHTTYSDGGFSVQEVFEAASKKGLKGLSITDHDSVDAFPLAFALAEKYGMEVYTGTELSCDAGGVDVHILGYFVDIHNLAFTQKLQELKIARYARAEKMVKNLNRQGIDLRFESVLKIANGAAIGRPHIAAAMLNEELIYSFKEAFDRFIGYRSSAYVEKLKLSPKEIFRLILDAGGIPVLAHPGITRVDNLIPQFVRDGLMGIEVFYSEHSTAMKKFYKEYAKKNNLLITGGSDFHGPTHNRAEVGIPKVSYSVIEKMRSRLVLTESGKV